MFLDVELLNDPNQLPRYRINEFDHATFTHDFCIG